MFICITFLYKTCKGHFLGNGMSTDRRDLQELYFDTIVSQPLTPCFWKQITIINGILGGLVYMGVSFHFSCIYVDPK